MVGTCFEVTSTMGKPNCCGIEEETEEANRGITVLREAACVGVGGLKVRGRTWFPSHVKAASISPICIGN